MTNLTTIHAAEATGLTHGEWWEVVVKEEVLGVFTTSVVVDVEFLVSRCEGANSESLGLTAGEDRRSMHTRQGADFTIEFAKVAKSTSVGANAFFHDGQAEGFLLNVFEDLLDFELGGLRKLLLDSGFHFVAEGSHFLTTLNLGGGVDRIFDSVTGDGVSDFEKVLLGHGDGVVTLGLTGEFHEFFLGFDDLRNGSLGEVERLFKLSVGNLVSRPFDHNDVGLVPHVDEVEVAVFTLFESRIDHEFSVDASHANGTNGTGEGNIGNRKCGGCAVHGENVGVVFLISTQKKSDDLGIVEIALGEERTQRTVGHAACQDLFFGRTTFTLEVATGECSGCRSAFLVFHRKGEPGLTLADLGL